MSQENIEFVQAFHEAWNAGDMDSWSELLDPDTILRAPENWPEKGPFLGREAVVQQMFVDQRNALDADQVVPLSDYRAVGDRVVVRFTWRGEGRGPDLSMEMSGIYTVRKGNIISQEYFWDHAEALEAVGLSE